MPLPADSFAAWFREATGHTPFPYQVRFATENELPNLLDVPTGLGKTACAVLTHDAAPVALAMWRNALGAAGRLSM